jgi:hypothetical protein
MARRTDRGEKAALTGPGGEPPNKRLKRDADSLAAAARLSRNIRHQDSCYFALTVRISI